MTNRFKRLDLIDRVCEELWREVCDTVQEAGIKTIPKKKFCKAKWLSEEPLQIAEKRREIKGQGEKVKPAECSVLRLARRDKTAFSEQCKEIEESERMGKTRDFSKKSRNSKGTFHAEMGTMKGRNSVDLTEAEEVASVRRTAQERSS